MYLEDANRKQLLQIALYEDCPMEYKYAACREIQIRQWHESMLPELISMWGKGMQAFDIAIEMGIPENTVKNKLKKYKLYRKRVIA